MTTADGSILGTVQIVDNGPANRRWNLVVMGDGYQAAQMAQYAADVQRFVNAVFSTPPFDELRTAINVFRVDVTSTDAGADDPTACGGTGATPRTFFDASFCNAGVQRLLLVNNTTAIMTASAQVPAWSMIAVVVNSTIYGGAGGTVATFSLAANAEEIGIHEMGHTAFGLADEYEYFAGCGIDTDRNNHPAAEPAEPNVTVNQDRTTLKWGDLVAASTPVPTTRNIDCTQCDPQGNPFPTGTVGLYEGAHYYHCEAFRPEFDCKMRALNFPFCAVCRRRIRQVLSPYLPANSVLAKHSGLVLDVRGASPSPGAGVIQWPLHGGANQQFRLEPLDDGTSRVAAGHSGQVLDVQGGSQVNGALVIQWPWHGGDNQRFRVEPVGAGAFRLVAKHSGLVLDVRGASTGDGTEIIQWPWHGGDNQRWRLFLRGAPIRSVHSGKVLDVRGASAADGAQLIQWPEHGDANQRFRLELLDDGTYRVSADHSGKVLDIRGASQANGALVIQWPWQAGTTSASASSPWVQAPSGWWRSTAGSRSTSGAPPLPTAPRLSSGRGTVGTTNAGDSS